MDENSNHELGIPQKIWLQLCTFFVKTFYKKVEVSGSDKLNINRPVILCANHSNALADAVLLQYSSTKLIHPLARSGLFKNPFLKIILSVWKAVPVYRRQDSESGQVDNDQMFSKVYKMLADNQILMIFPEGQSHSDPKLRKIKTGISRIILGYKEKYGSLPEVIPVGLNFTQTKRFRSNVFINYGDSLVIDENLKVDNEDHIKQLTDHVMKSMQDQVLEIDEVDDLVFVKQIERFFALRHKKIRRRNLSEKFKSHKLLLTVKNYLNQHVPDEISRFKLHLRQFNRLCRKLGINDYNLNVTYNSKVIRSFVIKSLFTILVMLPIGLWGFINSLIPFMLTQFLSALLARADDQRDTAKILIGTLFFSVFWGIQTQQVYSNFGFNIGLIYFLSLIPASLVALIITHEHTKIIDNMRVFFVLIKKKRLRRYLIRKRKAIEQELASLLKLARKYRE